MISQKRSRWRVFWCFQLDPADEFFMHFRILIIFSMNKSLQFEVLCAFWALVRSSNYAVHNMFSFNFVQHQNYFFVRFLSQKSSTIGRNKLKRKDSWNFKWWKKCLNLLELLLCPLKNLHWTTHELLLSRKTKPPGFFLFYLDIHVSESPRTCLTS